MVRIDGGEFAMGSDDPAFFDAQPVHRVHVTGFWIDATEVTNAQFSKFVEATGYKTVAERLGGAMVFRSPRKPSALDDPSQWWSWVEGANWRHPEGPGSNIANRPDHPVVQAAYDDALAYAGWAGKRLPTEAEWEFAARGGLDGAAFAWGDDFIPHGRHQANTFQGSFPESNTAEDGYVVTSPVRAFPPNGFGLYGVAGNVWEWVSDWYDADYYETLVALNASVVDPQGPTVSHDPSEPNVAKRVQKGGSFLCTDQFCARYMPGGRGRADPETPFGHTGFRLVRDIQVESPGNSFR